MHDLSAGVTENGIGRSVISDRVAHWLEVLYAGVNCTPIERAARDLA